MHTDKESRHPVKTTSLPLLFLLLALVATRAVEADDDDGDSHPGLVARFTAGDKSIELIDRDVQFEWGASSPDVRLPAGSFSARWTGQLLVRGEGRHAFHLYLQGEGEVILNGRTVASGRLDAPGWIKGESIPIEFGEQKLEVTYRKTGDAAIVRLFWSSESFPTEPVPTQVLFHEAPRPDLDLIERGSDLYEAHRCNACHRRDRDQPAEPAPALVQTTAALNRDWLIEWLVAPQKLTPHARMPQFGLSRDDARAVAEFLLQVTSAKPAEDFDKGTDPKAATRRGEVLFRSIGCLACHTRGNEGAAQVFGGGDLTHVGRKRTAGWLYRWLKEPEKLNSDHRMPVFKLTDDERRSLALFLSELGAAETTTPQSSAVPGDQTLATAGKKLIASARCADCHAITGFKPETSAIPTLKLPVKDWSKACTEAAADAKHVRPAYSLADNERRAIRAFVESRYGSLVPEGPFGRGQRLLRQKGCLNCHEREGGRGIASIAGAMARLDRDLAGQSESLVPPDLTAVGDKLHDEALAVAISGKQKTIRLPWLRVRMPQFVHQPADSDAVLRYLIGHDRVPDGALLPAEPADSKPRKSYPVPELNRSGQLLAGTRGFRCTACHKIGGYEPRGVALATRGSDLYLMGERMRPEYFIRWTRSPLRIIPGMEMPSFERPVPGILAGRIDGQLEALWEGLNDKSAPPKIDTSTVEQFLTVAPGKPPKIIRDVFNVGDAPNPQFVPKAFAIGFDNGVNLLFDLDTMSLRDHWYGDFARQRSSGKSWFWEPAAYHRVREERDPDIALRKEGDPNRSIVIARKESGRFGRLRKYERAASEIDAGALRAIKLEYTLTFDLPSESVVLEVTELYSPAPYPVQPKSVSGQRKLRVQPVPAGYEAVVRERGRQMLLPPAVDEGPYNRLALDPKTCVATGGIGYIHEQTLRAPIADAATLSAAQIEPVTAVPGYDGVRLPFPTSIMPTAITWTSDGMLAFCSLKGQVFLAKDTDGDGIEDKLVVFEEGLAAPYGLIADGKDLIVAHKPELLRLRDVDGDGHCDLREVVADGWGYTEDYHDWTTGIVRDSKGNLYVGTGSDYAKPGRERVKAKWRGKVLRIDQKGNVTPLGHGFRYPTGLAITPDDQVFVSDNQGVQNTFNEINHLVEGGFYGVPSLYEEHPDANVMPPAIQVPHPWTRSVNGIFFLPRANQPSAFAGHGIGCEYDNRFLVRFTLQRVGETYQGAVYPFSLPVAVDPREGFLGTLCGAVSPRGDIYIGSIHDSGWLGGPNIGDIVRLRPNGKLPVGIREIRSAAGEFIISFTGPIGRTAAAKRENYEISGYTRKWQGTYATPDSGRHSLEIQSVEVAADGLTVILHCARQQEGHVYDITCGKIGPPGQVSLWPTVGYYTVNRMP